LERPARSLDQRLGGVSTFQTALLYPSGMQSDGPDFDDVDRATVATSNNARQRRIRIAAIVMALLLALPIFALVVAELFT